MYSMRYSCVLASLAFTLIMYRRGYHVSIVLWVWCVDVVFLLLPTQFLKLEDVTEQIRLQQWQIQHRGSLMARLLHHTIDHSRENKEKEREMKESSQNNDLHVHV